jgi:hypothetical protein
MEIGNERIELPVFEYDTPLQLAYKFCMTVGWNL